MVVYITTNLVNGKSYIGRDLYNKPKYLGSGALLKKAIKKYGQENFEKRILQYCNTLNELIEAEEFWIRKYNAAYDSNFYNILDGSSGGDTLSNHPNLNTIKQKIKTARSKQIINHSTETKKKIGDAQRGCNGYWYGKTPSDEHRTKISNSLKGKPKEIIICPHCDKSGGSSQMKRWHFDNCSTLTGIKHSPTNKQPWNKGMKDPYSIETLNKMSNAKKGNIPWNKKI